MATKKDKNLSKSDTKESSPQAGRRKWTSSLNTHILAFVLGAVLAGWGAIAYTDWEKEAFRTSAKSRDNQLAKDKLQQRHQPSQMQSGEEGSSEPDPFAEMRRVNEINQRNLARQRQPYGPANPMHPYQPRPPRPVTPPGQPRAPHPDTQSPGQ